MVVGGRGGKTAEKKEIKNERARAKGGKVKKKKIV